MNCRIFPGEDPEQVRKTLERVIGDPKVSITAVQQKAADGSAIPIVPVPPSPLLPEVMNAMKSTVESMWPGLPIVTTLATGASDGKFLRIAVQDFYDGVEFNYRLIKAVSAKQ